MMLRGMSMFERIAAIIAVGATPVSAIQIHDSCECLPFTARIVYSGS